MSDEQHLLMTDRLKWSLLGAAAVLGGLAFAALAEPGPRAALSYLGGLVLVVAGFEFGVFNIRLADRYVPTLTMAIALLSYATTAVAFGLVLLASSPRVIYGVGVATGLLVGLAVWLGALLMTSLTTTRTRRS